MHAVLLLARLVHIIGGIYWVGAVFFFNIFLGPALQDAGPAGMTVMKALVARRYFDFTVLVALLTILAGFYLVWVDSAGFDPTWFRGAFGQAISLGMALAVVTFLLGVLVIKPTLNRMGAVGMQLAQATDADRAALTQEMSAVRGRMKKASMTVMLLLLVVASAMSMARYL